ncbi:Ankyrin repeat-containing domain protein [Rutstroemia sp. NJR-2017a BBW]|nr:Ankyrin repeat-containing domain protein [Rutstroemia sp. NJR-2017a BBW]
MLAGVGKTVLSTKGTNYLRSAVVKFLEQDLTMQEVGVAFVYCDHKLNDVQQHEFFICAIIRQLIERKQIMPEYAQTLYKNHIRTQSRPTSDEYLTLLQDVGEEYSEVYILIDALDECINKDREMIWNELLIDLKENVQNLRLLCTSRDIDSTETALSESTCIEIRASDGDMRAYIQGQIKSSHSLVRICRQDTSLENEILQVVVAKAEGMFLAAKLHVNALASKKHARAVRKALDTLPKDIDDIYDRTMERVQLHRQRDLAMQTLTWIVYATRPLAIEEVQQAIAIDDLDPDDAYITEDLLTPPDVIASVCAGLIKVDRESSVIRLVHKTTHEYFDRKGAQHFPGAKLHIGMSCLNYLSLALIEKDPNAGFENLWIRYQLKLYKYVGENLAHHLRGETDRRLLDLASQILMHPRIEYNYLSTRIVSSYFTAKLRNWDAPGGFCGIHFAALLGLESIIKHFMEDSTINIDLKDGDGRTPLWYASANGEYVVVKLLLEIDKIDINSKERYGQTPLWTAASEGHEEVVRLLLDMDNIDINSRDDEGQTPLRAAAEEGHEGVVKLLLEMDDVDNYSLDGNFRTALEVAATAGHEGVVKLLLESGAKSSDINSALIMAADKKHEPVVELLLENGADINTRTSKGERALMSAARRGHEPVVRLLLEKGADINLMTEKGKTALMFAARRGHESVVKLLLESGADINSITKEGRTTLILAARKGHEPVVKLLLENGADINSRGEEGETALILAAAEGHGDVVKLLLEQDVDINSMTRSDQGDKALILAAMKGHEDIVELLLERGADIDLMTEKGETVLTLAAAEGQKDVVKLLLEKGIADINTRAVFGFKALIMAIHQGHKAVVELLLLEKSVADLNEMTDHGNLALSLAAEKGHEAIIKLLLEIGKADEHEG